MSLESFFDAVSSMIPNLLATKPTAISRNRVMIVFRSAEISIKPIFIPFSKTRCQI
jgi:hypothetical protein